ncbi:hypothetical protein [Pseudonocardia sp. DLS-67]
MTDHAYKVRVLAEAGDCPTDGTCFVLGEVLARPGKVQAVAKIVDDPRLVDAYRHKIGSGEILVEFEKSDLAGAFGR